MADKGENGWVCYRPGALFWAKTRAELEHELSDGIRAATLYEELLFKQFGTRSDDGLYMVEPPFSWSRPEEAERQLEDFLFRGVVLSPLKHGEILALLDRVKHRVAEIPLGSVG